MKGYRKVLIAVNGSMDVLVEGLEFLCDESCKVTVVKVVPENDGDLNLTGVRNIEEVLDGGGAKAISEIRKKARAEGVFVKTRLEEGEIHDKIAEVALEERSELIIMGGRKRKGIRHFFSKNIVGKVIRRTSCPVLVVGS